MNLLDTPGHNDFSEDTYRTLAAADTAIMLIDSVKGVEPQTIKLFQVCRMRGMPIVTFINKMDRLGRAPLELLDEIEKVLGIPCAPVNWPIGSGPAFLGVYDRERREVLRFERADERRAHGAARGPAASTTPTLRARPGRTRLRGAAATRSRCSNRRAPRSTTSKFLRRRADARLLRQRDDQLRARAVPRSRSSTWRRRRARAQSSDGDASPPTATASRASSSRSRRTWIPTTATASPSCASAPGKFTRGMEVNHVRAGKPFTMARTMQFLAQERITIDEAYAGDILGVWDGGNLRIGDTLAEGASFEFEGVPALLARALRPGDARRIR